jgi:NTP pyrophosphatase (non-canonical NTP hydrolase)
MDMQLNTYQELAAEFALYPKEAKILYPTLGLTCEAGEVSKKVKKVIRDKNGVIDEAERQALKKELGDVLWYVAALASDLSLTMYDVAQSNIDKLRSRRDRNVLANSGDDR